MFLGFALVVGSSVLFTFNLLLIINSCFPWLGLSFKCKAVNRDLAVRFSRRTSCSYYQSPVLQFPTPNLLPVCLGISQMRNGKKEREKEQIVWGCVIKFVFGPYDLCPSSWPGPGYLYRLIIRFSGRPLAQLPTFHLPDIPDILLQELISSFAFSCLCCLWLLFIYSVSFAFAN